MSRPRAILVAAACAMAGSVGAQEPDAPDLGFLEYLGSWQENDEEWLIVSEWEQESEADEEAEAESEAGQEDEDE